MFFHHTPLFDADSYGKRSKQYGRGSPAEKRKLTGADILMNSPGHDKVARPDQRGQYGQRYTLQAVLFFQWFDLSMMRKVQVKAAFDPFHRRIEIAIPKVGEFFMQ